MEIIITALAVLAAASGVVVRGEEVDRVWAVMAVKVTATMFQEL